MARQSIAMAGRIGGGMVAAIVTGLLLTLDVVITSLLLLFGAIFGAAFCRKPLTLGRFLLIGLLSFVATLGVWRARDGYEDARWRTTIMEPHFERGTPERELVRRLGTPTGVFLEPDGPRHARDCGGIRPAKAIEYAQRGGGMIRTFYLDQQGRLLCDGLSMLHL